MQRIQGWHRLLRVLGGLFDEKPAGDSHAAGASFSTGLSP